MTISTTTRKAGPYTGNGSATSFTFAFKVFAATDVLVIKTDLVTQTDTTLVNGTGYTVTLNANQNTAPGGSITVTPAISNQYTLTILSAVPNLQPVDLTANGKFYPEVINAALDRQVAQVQQLAEQAQRALTIPVTTSGLSATLPKPDALKHLRWNAAADALENADVDTSAILASVAHSVEKQWTAPGQTIFYLTNSYLPGTNSIQVELNGAVLTSGDHYTETDANTITLVEQADDVERIVFKTDSFVNSPATSAASVSYTPLGAGASPSNVQDKLQITVNLNDFFVAGDADHTNALNRALAFFSSGQGCIEVERGTFYFSGRATIAKNGIRIKGKGPKVTQLVFSPASAETFLYFSKGASVLYGCGLEDLSLVGAGTVKKTGVYALDFSDFVMRNVEIRTFTGNGSTGLRTAGRECSTFEKIYIDADLPIQISKNPNYTIDCNEIVFRDLYLIANDPNGGCVVADDGVYFSGLTFEGRQAWVHGKYGFYHVDTTGAASSEKIVFRNVWKEQTDSASGYVFYVVKSGSANLQGITFENCHGDTNCNGYYLRGIRDVLFLGGLYTSNTKEALNVDATVINITNLGFHATGGSTATLTGQTLRAAFLKRDASSPIPDIAFYQSSGASNYSTIGAITSLSVGDGTITLKGIVGGSYATIYTETAHGLKLGTNNTSRWEIQSGGSMNPSVDNTYDLGSGSYRIATVYAGTGTINTSDQNEKQEISSLSSAELSAAAALKCLIKKFRFRDAVAEKGDAARIHVGAIAQEVEQAFISSGLDPSRYGLFCRDEWTDETGVVRVRLGLRYDELLAFVISAI